MKAVVVGGGIIGLSSAYYLSKKGVDVVVCEKSNIGAGSTERSAGGIRLQYSTRVNVELSLASMEVWDDFEEIFGVDIEHRRSGYMFLARKEETAERFKKDVEMQNELGVPSEYLEPEEASEFCDIDPSKFVGATYCDKDGFCDPHLAIQGFQRRCGEEGVDIRTGTEVIDVERHEDGVETVVVNSEDSDEEIDADYIVNTAGPWASQVGELAGIDLPISPKRRSIAVVEPEYDVPELAPLTIDLDTGSYFRPERKGRALVGGVFEGEDPDQNPDNYKKDIDMDWAVEAVEKAGDWAKYFGSESRIVRGWSGLYAVTPDHHPIIEESAPGVITAAGFSGHGLQHAPATGKIVSEIVVDGESTLVDIDVLGSERFEEEGGIVEHNVA